MSSPLSYQNLRTSGNVSQLNSSGLTLGRLRRNLTLALRSLKPTDWLVLTYLLATTPLLLLLLLSGHKDGGLWTGLVVRAIIIPTVLYWRFNLATTYPESYKRTHMCVLFGREVVWCLPVVMAALGDMYSLATCIYIYGETSSIIQALYGPYANHPERYWDTFLRHVDASLFQCSVDAGVGQTWRSMLTAHTRKVLGEYLSFCYFAFYGVLAITWLAAWIFLKREIFDKVSTTQIAVYILCLSNYLIMPTLGPFWTYHPPEPQDVGYFFSYINHAIVANASAKGTAFPSCHCAMSTAALFVSLMYMRPLGYLYLFICPGIVAATVFLGFHYTLDSMLGVLLAPVSVGLSLALCAGIPYLVPVCDHKYSASARANKVAVDEEAFPLFGDHYQSASAEQ